MDERYHTECDDVSSGTVVVDVDVYTKRFEDDDVSVEGWTEYRSVSDDSVVSVFWLYMTRFDEEVSDVHGDSSIPDTAYETETAAISRTADITTAWLVKAIL